jgi:hypothetical protein
MEISQTLCLLYKVIRIVTLMIYKTTYSTTLKTEAAHTFETSVDVYETTRHHIQEEIHS